MASQRGLSKGWTARRGQTVPNEFGGEPAKNQSGQKRAARFVAVQEGTAVGEFARANSRPLARRTPSRRKSERHRASPRSFCEVLSHCRASSKPPKRCAAWPSRRANRTTLSDSSFVRRPAVLRRSMVARERPSLATNSSGERSSCLRKASNSAKSRPGGGMMVSFLGGTTLLVSSRAQAGGQKFFWRGLGFALVAAFIAKLVIPDRTPGITSPVRS